MAAPKRKTPPRSAPARKSKADPAPRILVVEARFYDELADTLLAGAERALEAAGATWERITVPGALEIPARFPSRPLRPKSARRRSTARSRWAA